MEWHPTNRGLPTRARWEHLGTVRWMCRHCGHTWDATPVSRSANPTCPDAPSHGRRPGEFYGVPVPDLLREGRRRTWRYGIDSNRWLQALDPSEGDPAARWLSWAPLPVKIDDVPAAVGTLIMERDARVVAYPDRRWWTENPSYVRYREVLGRTPGTVDALDMQMCSMLRAGASIRSVAYLMGITKGRVLQRVNRNVEREVPQVAFLVAGAADLLHSYEIPHPPAVDQQRRWAAQIGSALDGMSPEPTDSQPPSSAS